MDMQTALKFCMGSVAKKDFIPALKHFVIEKNTVRGFNGVLALCSPIPFDISCRPQADTLIKAIAKCESTVQLGMTPTGRLSVKSGKFKTLVQCVAEDTPHALPEGEVVNFDGAVLLAGLKAVSRFMGEDAARRWAQGVYLKDQCAIVTNNIVIVQYWLGAGFPEGITIPREAVKEMIRINEAPIFAQVAQNSITFHYSGDRWLRTQLWDSDQWPDFSRILDRPSAQSPLDEELFDALEMVKPFVSASGAITFEMQRITTHPDDLEEATTYEVPSITDDGKYHVDMLMLLKGVVTTIDWSMYPSPVLFTGERLRGAIVGMRKPPKPDGSDG